jgi:hypothetical protein
MAQKFKNFQKYLLVKFRFKTAYNNIFYSIIAQNDCHVQFESFAFYERTFELQAHIKIILMVF